MSELVGDLDSGVDGSDQMAVDGLDLSLDLADDVLVLMELGIQGCDGLGMTSALGRRMVNLVRSSVFLMTSHGDLVSFMVDMSLQLSDSSKVSLNRCLVSSSSLNQQVESVLKIMSGVNADMSNMGPMIVSSLVVSDAGLEVVDCYMDSVHGNSVSFERNSESSDVGLMLVELMLDSLARLLFLVTELDFMLILGSKVLDDMSFGSDESLVIGDLVNMYLNLSMMDSDLMAQMVDVSSVLVDHFLVGANFLVIVFTVQLSCRA